MSDSAPSAAVDCDLLLPVLDAAWASAALPEDDAPRQPGELPPVLDEEGSDIFDRSVSEQERQRLAYVWLDIGNDATAAPAGADDEDAPADWLPVWMQPEPAAPPPPPLAIAPTPPA